MIRHTLLFGLTILFLVACNKNRVYHEYVDFDDRQWNLSDTPVFQFSIADTSAYYNVFCNVRNSASYPYSRIFIQYALTDTNGHVLHEKLLNEFLFDRASGEPYGKSALGDLFDHKLPIMTNHRFNSTGPFEVKFIQYMRKDTLAGVVAVGLGIEKVETAK